MSTIYFHSPSGTAKVSGAERHYAGVLCTDLLCIALGINGFGTESKLYRKLLPPGAYPLNAKSDAEFFFSLRTWMNGLWEPSIFTLPDGTQIDTFDAALNTAVAGGSDAVRLLAKLHAQCEIHCYVEGPHRVWLAEVIEQGVKDNVLRTWKRFDSPEYGWQSVSDLLRRRDDEPVVTSYSVTDHFPNRYMAMEYGEWKPPTIDIQKIRYDLGLGEDEDVEEYRPEYEAEVWYALPKEEHWQYALAGLRRANESGHLEIRPDDLGTQGYGNGLSGFDIMATLYDGEEDKA